MALRAAMSDTIVTNIKTVITPKDLNQGEQIFFNAELPAKQIRPGQYDLYFAIGNKEADVWFDVIDGNINLPAMLILPSSDDVHENMGFFSTDFSITNISIR
jgi:lipopolysaccharide transport system ATP-binding protein